MAGIRNAKVLPLPVLADPTRSLATKIERIEKIHVNFDFC